MGGAARTLPPRWLRFFLPLLVAVLTVLSVSLVAPAAAAPAAPAPSLPAAPAPASPRAAAPVASGTPGGLPGTNPSGVASASPQSLQSLYVTGAARDLAFSAAAANHTSPALAGGSRQVPPPSGALVATGTATGFVVNESNPSDDLSGVTVQSFANSAGNLCNIVYCPPVTSLANGSFTVTCGVGPDYLSLSKPFWVTNITYFTCRANTTVSVGTVELIADGFVSGRVVGDVSTFPGLPGVMVQGESRDYSVLASPQVVTSGNGSFTVPVPADVAARIDFNAPSSAYQNNFTYAQLGPFAHVDIGLVDLEPNVIVKAQLYDAVTGAAVDGGYMTPDSLTLCSLVTNVCGVQGPATTYGNTVTAAGPPGYDYVLADGVGYLENSTPIGNVVTTSPGQVVCVPNHCDIYLTPLGEVKWTTKLAGSASPAYSTGLFANSVCGLNGFKVAIPKLNPTTYTYNTTTSSCVSGPCGGIGSTIYAPAFPLRNDIQIFPDTVGDCGFAPMWPIPGLLPVWGNETWANVTPYETTDVGELDLTPGSYVSGQVYVAGSSAPPAGGFVVSVSSRIGGTLSTYPFYSATSPLECGSGAGAFCVPAPPGPDRLIVSAQGFPQNYTWIGIPWKCCSQQNGGLGLGSVTVPGVASLNLTPQVMVNGSVHIAGSALPVPFGIVSVCPASSVATGPCAEQLINAQGNYSVPNVPLGWDNVQVASGGYELNSEWIHVGTSGATAPPIPLTPSAILSGYVRSTNGSALIDATVDACLLASTGSSCGTPLGAGMTTSGGYYQGFENGGFLPGATYEVAASAPGYVADWTFVNASSNATTLVPTLYLAPVGHLAGGLAEGKLNSRSTPSPGAWVVGRLVDNLSGLGVMTQQISACSVVSGVCPTGFSDGSNSGGFFNGSVPAGVYNVTVDAAGYEPLTILLSVLPSQSVVSLGTLQLTPLPMVAGRVTLYPWSLITVSYGTHTARIPLAPPVSLQVCNTVLCTPNTFDASSGAFMVESFVGTYLQLRAIPVYTGTYTSAPGGVVSNVSTFNLTHYAPLTNLSFGGPAMPLFAAISGSFWNAAGCDGPKCTDPARWVTVSALTSGVNNGAVQWTANGGGQVTVFLPGGNDAGATTITANDPNFYYSAKEVVLALLGPAPGENLTYTEGPLALTSFGYAYAEVVDSATHQPVVGVGLQASFSNTATGRYGATTEITNGAGFVNVTAPSASSVGFAFGGVEGYNSSFLQAAVTPGNATDLETATSLNGAPVQLPPWGWVRSVHLTYSAGDLVPPSVQDALNHQPLPGAVVSVASSDTAYGFGSSLAADSIGAFLSAAPIGPRDSLVATLAGYETNTSGPLNITPGRVLTVPSVNLTGDGVLSSSVIAVPGDVTVAGALVSVCTGNGGIGAVCTSATTNATGHYWVAAPPGHLSISVSATNYVSNYTEFVALQSDQWESIPAFQLVEDGIFFGTIRGLPTGLPISGATVSACSPLGGTPTGPCLFAVSTLANGSFSLPVPPGQYILTLSAPDFNTTYLSISVQPGETIDLGPLFLQEYGVLAGFVVDATTGVPIAGATVAGCPVDPYLACDTPTTTDSGGHYRLASPPGGMRVVASANGFMDGYVTATAVSGATSPAPVLRLAPILAPGQFRVNGRIVLASNPSVGIPGATAGFWVGTALADSAQTDASGYFTLLTSTGTYTLVASAPGYATSTTSVLVNSTVSGLRISLAPFGWDVRGSVTDGLTGAPIGSAEISNAGVGLGSSDAGGRFDLALANGTYYLSASAPNYGNLTFEVDVVAASIVRSIELFPPEATVSGTVLGSNGAPLPGASVTFGGTVVDGATLLLTVLTGSDGTFHANVYYGHAAYTVTANAAGYHSDSGTVLVSSSGAASLTLSLSSLPASPTTSSSTDLWYVVAGAALLGGAVIAAFVWGRRSGGTS